jgi:replication factor C small subunit
VHIEVFRLDVPESLKMEIEDLVAETDYRLVEGANEDIQITAFLAQLAKLSKKMAG